MGFISTILLAATLFGQSPNFQIFLNQNQGEEVSNRVKFTNSIITDLSEKFTSETFLGIVTTDNTPLYSTPTFRTTKNVIERISFGTNVEIVGNNYRINSGFVIKVRHQDKIGWVGEQYLRFNENTKYLLQLIKTEENLATYILNNIEILSKDEKNEYRVEFINKLFSLVNFNIKMEEQIDSLRVSHKNQLTNVKGKSRQNKIKIENNEKLIEFEDSLIMEKIKLKEKYDKEYPLFIDSLNTVIKRRLENEKIIKEKRVDSLNRVQDSLQIIQKEVRERKSKKKTKGNLKNRKDELKKEENT